MSASKSKMTQRTPPPKTDMTHSVSETDIPNFLAKESDNPPRRNSVKRLRVEDNIGQDPWKIFKEEIKEMIECMSEKQTTRLDKLEKSILGIKKQNDLIHNSNSDLKKSMDLVSDQMREIQNKITNLEGERKAMTKQIDIMDMKIENLERINKKTRIEIRNVPKRQKEGKRDLYNLIERLHSSIDTQDKTDAYQLRDVYRLPSKPNATASTVVAEFSNTLAKDNFLGKVKRYMRNKFEQLSSKHLGINETQTFIYVSEHLSMKATRLFFLARDFAKTEGFNFCWTSSGRVFLRKKENAPHILVMNEETLSSIRGTTNQAAE